MSKNKISGDMGEQEIVNLIACPNCKKKLMLSPKNYPLFDVQCEGCSFRAQVKTNNTKPKPIIFGAGWDIMEKTKEVLEREKQISDILKSQNLQIVGGGSGPNFPNPKAKREMFLTGYDMSKCQSSNEMIVVRLNLFTGKAESQTTPCAISMN